MIFTRMLTSCSLRQFLAFTRSVGPMYRQFVQTINRELILSELQAKWEKEQKSLKELQRLQDVKRWENDRHCYSLETASSDEDTGDEENISTRESARIDDLKRSLNSSPTDCDSDSCLRYIAGTDISFVKGDDVRACASLVVVEFPDLKVVYEDTSLVEITVPYIPGFLAFRECPHFIEKFRILKERRPELMPQAILVDGNGTLHTSRFGVACHLGVLLDIPTVGVAKTLFHVDGLEKNEEHVEKVRNLLKKAGDTFPLTGNTGIVYGMALRCHDTTTNPVYVSPGHNITLDTAVWLVRACSLYRIPEPIRQADIRSRQYLRELEEKQQKPV